MRIYIAGPLFNEMEIQRNISISEIIENEGFETYLPQRDGGLFYNLQQQGYSDKVIKDKIFTSDYQAILSCDVLLCLLDGRVLDEGMCIELGIAFAIRKHCIGFKTDFRSQDKFGNNIMLDGTLSNVFSDKILLIEHLREISSHQLSIH